MNNILIYRSSFFFINTIKLKLKDKFSIKKFYTVNTTTEVNDLLSSVVFDLIILDVNFESIDDYNLIKTIEKKKVINKLLILSSVNDDFFINRCRKLKTKFFLDKNCSEYDFNKVLRKIIIQDYKVKVKSKRSKLTDISLNLTDEKRVKRLSKRETQIAHLLVNGVSNVEISKHLSLSMTTISTYKKRLLLKTETSNIIELSDYFKKRNVS
jgi:DNA-binding NarL/FixJ family response regulator